MSDLGFPARGAKCPSQQFSEEHFVLGGGGVTIIIFFILTYRVLCYQQMQYVQE